MSRVLICMLAAAISGGALACDVAQKNELMGMYYKDGGDRAIITFTIAPGETKSIKLSDEFHEGRRVEVGRYDGDQTIVRLVAKDGTELYHKALGSYAGIEQFRLADCGGRFVVETHAAGSSAANPCSLAQN